MTKETKNLMQRMQADPNTHVNWKFNSFRSKKEIEQAKREWEVWDLVDEIISKHQNSSKFTRVWINFLSFKTNFDRLKNISLFNLL